jgi:hypothetical protein
MLAFKHFFKEACDCWKNYKRKPGTKPCAPGSCIKEENNAGYEGTDKLTTHRKKITPGEKPKTPDMLPDYSECENIQKNK